MYSDSTLAGRERLSVINQFIRESQNISFSGTWALLVDWSKVHPYNHQAFINEPSLYEGPVANYLNSVSYNFYRIPYIMANCVIELYNYFIKL